MRDPGPSRPNPLFARETVDDPTNAPDEPEGARASGPRPGADWARLDDFFAPSGSAAEAVVASMLEAGPEAVEHLMNAGQELLLAAKAMLDAAERGLEQHRRAEAEAAGAGEGDDAHDVPGSSANVTRLDLG